MVNGPPDSLQAIEISSFAHCCDQIANNLYSLKASSTENIVI